MTQRETLERIFQKYGETVHIRGNDVKGMLRPLQWRFVNPSATILQQKPDKVFSSRDIYEDDY